jgi:hypothetical protein
MCGNNAKLTVWSHDNTWLVPVATRHPQATSEKVDEDSAYLAPYLQWSQRTLLPSEYTVSLFANLEVDP